MPNIAAKVFGGMNDNKSLTDLSVVKAETIKNFEIAKKIGKLRKRNGLTDNFASYPWTTITSIFKMEVTKPSAQTIFVVHAVTSGTDKLYIRPYLDWDGTTWVDSWQELTEGIESLTLTNATDFNSVVFTGPTPNATADYYKNWVVCNFTLGKQALVTSSSESGGTGTLELVQPGIGAQTDSDTISVYRFPLIFQHSGEIEADTSVTTGTTVVDANDSTFTEILDTKARVNDYYNGWTVNAQSAVTINNPGFETAGGGGADIWADWTEVAGSGALANETGFVFAGSDACKATTNAGPAQAHVYQDVTVVAGASYLLKFHYSNKDNAGIRARYRVRDLSNAADIISETDVDADVGYQIYIQQWSPFVTPSGCISIRIYLYSPSAAGICYFDAVVLTREDGSSTTISDFESSPFSAWGKVVYTLTADISVVDGTVITLFDASRNLDVDDVNLFQHSNKAIITLGNDDSYPKQFPLSYLYLKEYAFFSSSKKNLPGYYLYPATLDAPGNDVISTLGTIAGDLDDASTAYNYFVRIAFVYDGGQIGPLSSIEKAINGKVAIANGSSLDLQIVLQMGFNAGPCQRFNRMMDYRIKAIRIYIARNEAAFNLSDSYFFIEEVQVRGDTPNLKTSSDQGDDEWDGSDPYNIEIVVSAAKWTAKGNSYVTDAGISADSARITTQANYKHRIDLTTRSVIANVNIDEKEPANLLYSTITAAGDYSMDVHPPLQTIPLGRYGASDIKGAFSFLVFEEQLNRIVVFDRNIVVRLRIATAATFDFEIEKIITERGCGSSKSIAKVDRFLFYYSPKVGVCMYDGNRVHIISNLPNASIQRALDAITTDSYHENAIGWYYPRMRQYWLHIQTGASTFRLFKYQMYDGVSMLGGEWIEDSYPNQLVGGFVDKVGDLYIADTTKIYKADDPTATDDDGTDIVPEWKSKLIQPDEENEIDFHEMYAFYKSNTVIEVNPYLDGSGTEIALVNESWPAKTTLGKGENKIQIGLGIGEQLQLEAEIPAASQGTNTSFDLDEVGVVFDVLEKVR